jgi:hypothetical protein
MRLQKTHYLFLCLVCSCLVFLSNCGVASTGIPAPTSTAQTTSTLTTGATAQSTTPIATPVPTQQTANASCPANGTLRAASLSSDVSPAQGAVFYIAAQGGGQVPTRDSVLKRYDLSTGKTTTLLSFAHTSNVIVSAQLSPDKRWLFLVVTGGLSDPFSFQLMGVDGTHQQTLFCSPSGPDGGPFPEYTPQWSPDGQQIALSEASTGAATTIFVLNLVTGQQKLLVNGPYTPVAWINNHQLYASSDVGYSSDLSTEKQNLYLLDTDQGTGQQPTLVASELEACASYVLSSNAQQLFSASCTFQSVNKHCPTDESFDGPGSLNTQSTTGGSVTPLYSVNNLAIEAIQPIGTSVLFYQSATVSDPQQSGLWVLNSSGQATHLISDNASVCYNPDSTPAIASNALSYALLTNYDQLLEIGSRNSGSPTTIATVSRNDIGDDDLLTLIGMA